MKNFLAKNMVHTCVFQQNYQKSSVNIFGKIERNIAVSAL